MNIFSDFIPKFSPPCLWLVGKNRLAGGKSFIIGVVYLLFKGLCQLCGFDFVLCLFTCVLVCGWVGFLWWFPYTPINFWKFLPKMKSRRKSMYIGTERVHAICQLLTNSIKRKNIILTVHLPLKCKTMMLLLHWWN